ncbi:unnamed protein product [Diamesa tonsa]
MEDEANRVDEISPLETSQNQKKILCTGNLQKLYNFIKKTPKSNEEIQFDVIHRKLSSNWIYKLKDENKCIKTLWPVTCREYLFLPEFKVEYNELDHNYKILDFIAKGTFGRVYKIEKVKSSGEILALKVLVKSKIIDDKYVNQLKDEVKIQEAISHHQFIVTSHSHWQDKSHIYQVSEYCSLGELFHNITKFTFELIQLYVAELAITLDFLHNAGVIYRDLKPENILIDNDFHIKLTDFGLSKWLRIGSRTNTFCGTLNLMAPEIFQGQGYTHAVDWYSLGVVACLMLSGQVINCIELKEVKSAIKNNVGFSLANSSLNSQSNDLLLRLMEKNPQHRLKSLLGLKRIAFYKNYNFDDVSKKKITESLDLSSVSLGLNGIKFLLDESGDIIWFNDLFSIQVVAINDEQSSSPTIWLSKSMVDNTAEDKSKYSTGNESADILFSCETFEVIDPLSNGPALLFRSFTGHHIEFRTFTLTPLEHITLTCEGWCSLTCKRIKKDQSIGQSIQYTLLSAYEEKFFSDVTIKSCDNFSFEAHSPILRLNGFDCSSINQGPMSSSTSAISSSHVPSSLASNFLSPPTIHLSTFNFSPNFVNHISNSFNCLTSSRDSIYLAAPLANSKISSSDSHLNNIPDASKDNVFDFPLIQVPPPPQQIQRKNEQKQKLRLSSSQIIYKSPLSPFRVRSSPLPFLNLSLDTPLTPSSPLTSVSVLFNLTKDTLMPVLYWLYSESLPPNLNETQLESLLKLCATIAPLNKMIGPCKKYLRLIKLKKVLIDIFTDIHSCLNRMIQILNPYYVARCPSTLCELFKQCLREVSLGCALFLQLSQIFSKDTFLNRFQRNEIIKFIKTRIPIFISQTHQLLQNILVILKSLQPDEKNDLINYLVPEIILALEVTTEITEDLKNSLEIICKNINLATADQQKIEDGDGSSIEITKLSSKTNSSHAVDKDLKFFLHVCEVKQLHDIYGKVNSILEVIQHKQMTFNSMNLAEKQTCISINMDHLLIEIPIVIERLEELSRSMDDKVGWKEFKFCFKFMTSHINGILSKLLEHKATLFYPISKLCQLVNKRKFTKKIIELELMDKKMAAKNMEQSDNVDVDSEQTLNKDYNIYKINLFSGLCESPNANNSNLSKNALKLLHSGHLSDMEFEVITTATSIDPLVSLSSTPVSVITPNTTNGYDYNETGAVKKEYHIFKAHRVIVAARCEYLKKALLSGMQEDINRKITIYDTSPVIFRRFLLYLYGGPIDKSTGLESICELMLLADRYSVESLKEVCEQTLIDSIDCESVICMISISDRFNANTLKANCLSYLSQHIELTGSEMFRELSSDLQAEVFELVQWRGRATEPWNFDRHLSSRYDDPLRSRHSLKSPSRPSKSRSRKSSPSYHK